MGICKSRVAIVTPVFNDWGAFSLLLKALGGTAGLDEYNVHLIAVDDASSEEADIAALERVKGGIDTVEVVRLACNLGHQRAIAVGLVKANAISGIAAVVVMDSDGEDRPSDVPRILAAWKEQPEDVVVAERGLRSEGFWFRAFYKLYKALFRGLTGQTINFGNFSVLPKKAVEAQVHNPALWNNIAATIARSRMPYRKIKIDRGKRLAGRSRMNFVSLVIHGVGAMSVYADVVLVRVASAACVLAALVLIGIMAVIMIKLATSWAIPGWASYLAASLASIFLQSVLLCGLAVIQLLASRILRPFIPAEDAHAFVLEQSARSSQRGKR